MAYANTFMRREVKYILSEKDYAAVRTAIAPYMTEDKYGKHAICNIYCDSVNSDLIRSSLDKPVYKEKLRLRSYGKAKDDSNAFLEIKKKYKGVVYKRRLQMPYKELFDYVTYGIKPQKQSQVLEEIDYLINRAQLMPKIVICYDRLAMFGNEDNEFRLTFDGNIRSRTDNLDLRAGDYGTLLSGQPFRIMEIKVADSMPLWMTQILSELKIQTGSFSKYGSIYTQQIIKDMKDRSIDICSKVS